MSTRAPFEQKLLQASPPLTVGLFLSLLLHCSISFTTHTDCKWLLSLLSLAEVCGKDQPLWEDFLALEWGDEDRSCNVLVLAMFVSIEFIVLTYDHDQLHTLDYKLSCYRYIHTPSFVVCCPIPIVLLAPWRHHSREHNYCTCIKMAGVSGKKKLEQLKVAELRDLLEQRGLSKAGIKQDLVKRLKEVIFCLNFSTIVSVFSHIYQWLAHACLLSRRRFRKRIRCSLRKQPKNRMVRNNACSNWKIMPPTILPHVHNLCYHT